MSGEVGEDDLLRVEPWECAESGEAWWVGERGECTSFVASPEASSPLPSVAAVEVGLLCVAYGQDEQESVKGL